MNTPPRGVDVPEPGDEYDEPIASTEGGDIPPAALEPYDDTDEPSDATPDPNEEPS
jgi:hypothetical protein